MTPSAVQAPLPSTLSQHHLGIHRVNKSRKMLSVDGDDRVETQPTLNACTLKFPVILQNRCLAAVKLKRVICAS